MDGRITHQVVPYQAKTGGNLRANIDKCRLRLFDAEGRLLRDVFGGVLPAGRNSLTWDGRLRDGTRAPGGIFFLRLDSEGGQVRTGRVSVVR